MAPKRDNGYRGMTAKKAAQNAALRAKRVLFVREAKQRPCMDCGIEYPYYVMQFDHVRSKKEVKMSFAHVERTGLERLAREIEKCDVVCANCHAERSHQRRHAPQEQV